MAEQKNSVGQYEKMLKLIADIEKDSEKKQSAEVDISSAFSVESRPALQTYDEILSLINEIERKGRIFSRQKPIQTERMASVQEVRQNIETPSAPVQEGAPASAAENKAKEELAELTKELPLNIPLFSDSKLKKVKISDLVLPNLSIMDQVAELERIIEGIKGGAFNNDDISIVKEELYGLAKAVNDESKELRKKSLYEGGDYQLRLLREQRLEEAIKMLSSRLSAS